MNPYPQDDDDASTDAPKTVAAFVNKNSGERAAAAFVREQLESCLGEEKVFDLFPTAGQPPAIDEAKEFLVRVKPDMIIVAGGDGTVSLGMDICDALRKEMKMGKYECPVAVLPMGTGNDLSRSLGFGGGYVKPTVNAEKKFAKLIDKTKQARQKLVDRFRCDIFLGPAIENSSDDEDESESAQSCHKEDAARDAHRSASSTEQRSTQDDVYTNEDADKERRESVYPTEEEEGEGEGEAAGNRVQARDGDRGTDAEDSDNKKETYRPPRNMKKVFSKSFMNYYSVGFDADIAADFGQFRENHPKACANRTLNKMWYFFFGCKAMCCSSSFPKHRVSLRIDNVKMKVSSKSEAIVVSNMLTYAGGAVLWQDSKHKFPAPAVDDRKAETCILNGVLHMVGVGANTRSAKKMGQGSTIRIRVPADYVMQYDGEPITALGGSHEDCVVYITHVGQSLGMELTKNKQDPESEEQGQEDEDPPQQTENPIPSHA